MLRDQNYYLEDICKIIGQKQVIYRLSNIRKIHWQSVPSVLGHLYYPKIEHTTMYIFS